MNPSLYLKCPKCKVVRNVSLAPLCSVCLNTTKTGRLSNDRAKEQRNQFLEKEELGRGFVGRGFGGGPKPHIKTCPKCGYNGFAARNSSGRRCMCGGCGKRVF